MGGNARVRGRLGSPDDGQCKGVEHGRIGGRVSGGVDGRRRRACKSLIDVQRYLPVGGCGVRIKRLLCIDPSPP